MNMTAAIEALTGKALAESTDQEIYLALLDIVREQSAERVRARSPAASSTTSAPSS